MFKYSGTQIFLYICIPFLIFPYFNYCFMTRYNLGIINHIQQFFFFNKQIIGNRVGNNIIKQLTLMKHNNLLKFNNICYTLSLKYLIEEIRFPSKKRV